MSDTSGPVRADHVNVAFNVAGLVAAAIWAVGLLVGVFAVVTGHTGVAVIPLVLAVMAPWFGLTWVSHSQRRAYHVALYFHRSRADRRADLPPDPYGLGFIAR